MNIGETRTRWCEKKSDIAFHLYIYDERNNGKIIKKYLFYNVNAFPFLKVLFKSSKYYKKNNIKKYVSII